MTTATEDALHTMLDAVHVSRKSFTWFGVVEGRLPSRVHRALGDDELRVYLGSCLASRLYADFYTQGVARRTPAAASRAAICDHRFVQELSAANSGTGQRLDDWQLVGDRPGYTEAQSPRDKLRFTLPANGEPGEMVIHYPKEMLGISPGFYMALGDAVPGTDFDSRTLRVYWNLTPPGAVDLMAWASRILNEHGVPFKLKVLGDPAAFDRCDTCVLYIHQGQYSEVAGILAAGFREFRGHLRRPTPAFTQAIAEGIAVAEDPGTGESFGQHRCALVTEGLLRARDTRRRSDQRYGAIAEAFAAAGLDPAAVHLGRGSRAEYEPLDIVGGFPRARPAAAPLRGMDAGVVARRIGEWICGEAVWSDSRCTWVEPLADRLDARGGQARATSSASIGPDLYAGTAGVAWFLAALAVAGGSEDARRTAVGALEHSLTAYELATLGPNLFTSCLGPAVVALRWGQRLAADRAWDERVEALLRRCVAATPSLASSDLLVGEAGAVLGWLEVLRLRPAWHFVLDEAIAAGDRIIASAELSRHGCSWSTPGIRVTQNLTGYSHGAAGIAHALTELFAVSNDGRYRDMASCALRYERSTFSAARRNWPDFRMHQGQRRGVTNFMHHWCHGAGGILLSRVNCGELLGDPKWRTEADTAVETLRRGLREDLAAPDQDHSLCHGTIGNAEILSFAVRALGAETPADDELCRRAAHAGAAVTERHGWEPFTRGRATPIGLMNGLCGLGNFFLRRSDPTLPSPLVVGRAAA